jgi:hypothetical protein
MLSIKVIYHGVIGWVRPSLRGVADGPVDSDNRAVVHIGIVALVFSLNP